MSVLLDDGFGNFLIGLFIEFGGVKDEFGYIGLCKKILEDEELVIYSYAGENWSDGGKSKCVSASRKCRQEKEIY